MLREEPTRDLREPTDAGEDCPDEARLDGELSDEHGRGREHDQRGEDQAERGRQLLLLSGRESHLLAAHDVKADYEKTALKKIFGDLIADAWEDKI